MAFTLDSPHSKGYFAARQGTPRTLNPYYFGSDSVAVCKWFEWDAGWLEYMEGKLK